MTKKLTHPSKLEKPDGKWVYKKTRKLHDKRWLYRITFVVVYGKKFVRRDMPRIPRFVAKQLQGAERIEKFYPEQSSAIRKDMAELLSFYHKVLPFVTPETLITHRFGCPAIFTSNKKIVDDICDILGEYIAEVCGPTDEYARSLLGAEENVLLCRRLPYEHYQYKVSFDSVNFTREEKKRFVAFFTRTPESEIMVLQSVQYWARNYQPTCDQYVYVKDAAALEEFKRVFGDKVYHVAKYVEHRKSYEKPGWRTGRRRI